MSLLQAAPAFVTVGSLFCLGCIFLAVKTCADDWELLIPQHDSTLLDLWASISHSSVLLRNPLPLPSCPHCCKRVGNAIPLLCACIIGAASQTLYCEFWKDFGDSGNSCSSLNCLAKWPLTFCSLPLLQAQFSLEWVNEELKGGARCFSRHV